MYGATSRYRLLVLKQGTAAGDEALSEISLPGSALHVDRLPWSESMRPAGDRPYDLLLSIASPRVDEARVLVEWLGRVRCIAPVLAVLPDDLSQDLLKAVSRSVEDFVLRPVRRVEVQERIARILGASRDVEAVKTRLIEELGLSSFVGADPIFLRVVETIPRLAASEGTVVITGETGTGKELCARAIHHLSRRRSRPFIPVDCGAFPEQLFENELFGHSRGAFTGAYGDQRGLAALAEGGTLFLDEVDSLSLPAQAKLLRFLEDRGYKPLGAERITKADVRIVAATNRELEACVKTGQFRRDLFFRLNVFTVRMPALRERPGDIALLAQHFLDALAREGSRRTLSPAAARLLASWDWPGNVRELHNVVQRAVAVADGGQILPSHVTISLGAPVPDARTPQATFREARARAVDAFEELYVKELLQRHDGNITQAAREAGKDRRAFGRLVKKHRVRADAW